MSRHLATKVGCSFFVDGGINLPWYKRELTSYQEQFVTSSKFNAGPWGSAGLGYKWRLSTRSDKALLVSAGYSLKKLREKLLGVENCDVPGCPIMPVRQT